MFFKIILASSFCSSGLPLRHRTDSFSFCHKSINNGGSSLQQQVLQWSLPASANTHKPKFPKCPWSVSPGHAQCSLISAGFCRYLEHFIHNSTYGIRIPHISKHPTSLSLPTLELFLLQNQLQQGFKFINTKPDIWYFSQLCSNHTCCRVTGHMNMCLPPTYI